MIRRTRQKRGLVGLDISVERLDDRVLLSAIAAISPLLTQTIGYVAVRPNTPVLPFATPAKKATYIDPTVSIKNGNSVVMGYQDFIGPYATLDGAGGAIKIGNGSDVLDNASVVADGGRGHRGATVLIGGAVVVGFGATILGPSTIGSYSDTTQPVSIGANALIDGATIEPGAIVSPLARVGPGVTVPSGYMVLPGANVTTNAEASNPKLGMVTKVTSSELATITKTLSENEALATGYVTLYQGSSATGANTGVSPGVSGVDNGDLAAILGANEEPISSFLSSRPAEIAPQFLSPHRGLVPAALSTFPARISGNVAIGMQAWAGRPPHGTSQCHSGRPGAADRDRFDRSHRASCHD